jgi:hypothetical protein
MRKTNLAAPALFILEEGAMGAKSGALEQHESPRALYSSPDLS